MMIIMIMPIVSQSMTHASPVV